MENQNSTKLTSMNVLAVNWHHATRKQVAIHYGITQEPVPTRAVDRHPIAVHAVRETMRAFSTEKPVTEVRAHNLKRSWLSVLALVLLSSLFMARPAFAQLNGSFTNGGSGWVGLGPATNGGAPRVVTNSSGTTVLQIGTNAAAGVPGSPGAKVRSTGRNVCLATAGSYCAVHFHADWTPVGTETAQVIVSYKQSTGSQQTKRNITSSGNHVVNIADGCPSMVQVIFTIESNGKPVSSVLEISDVSISCDTNDDHTLALLPRSPFDDPPAAAYPLPYGSGEQGLLTVSLPAGLSPIANPFNLGGNSLNEVLFAQNGTMLFKYDPQSASFEMYYCNGGWWWPSDGTLNPGDAAFIDSPAPQQFDLRGQYAPMPLATHPYAGSALFANPVSWPVLLEDVMGFKPVMGDILLMFRHGDTNATAEPAIETSFVFLPETFSAQPVIPPGETVRVIFADPSRVPLSIKSDGGDIIVSAPGELPGNGILQTASSVQSEWKSLLGIADYYSEPVTNGAHFFRMGFGLPTGQIFGRIVGNDGAPAAGAALQLGPNGETQTADFNGLFMFTNVPQGLVDVQLVSPVQVIDMVTSEVSEFPVTLPIPVSAYGAASMDVKAEIVAQVIKPPPPCDCVPWCGVVGGTVDGVQKVVIGGGKYKPNCNGVAVVTISGPGGVKVNLGQGGRKTFSPAADGTWTVTSTVCGITRTCSITLP